MKLKDLQDHDITNGPDSTDDSLLLHIAKVGEFAKFALYEKAGGYSSSRSTAIRKRMVASTICTVFVIANEFGVDVESAMEDYVESWEEDKKEEQRQSEMEEKMRKAIEDGDYERMAEIASGEDDEDDEGLERGVM